jgi:hypothetical protein
MLDLNKLETKLKSYGRGIGGPPRSSTLAVTVINARSITAIMAIIGTNGWGPIAIDLLIKRNGN